MHASRRAFLINAAAAAALSGLPASLPGTAHAGSPAEDFGFTFGDGLYRSGHATRAEAIEAALAYGTPGPFQTARVTPLGLHFPDDLAERAAEGVLDAGRIGNDMVDWLTGSNEDADFEGEFADACNARDRSGLGDAGRAALSSAFVRAGREDLAEMVRAGGTLPEGLPEPLVDAIATDAELSADLRAALVAWVEAEDLGREARGLHVEAVEEHGAVALAA